MVSLYGHSLGSFLSYDILCHQENMSSPFPVVWLYNEHPRNEEFVDDQFCVGDPLKNIEDNAFHVVNIAKDKAHSAGEELSSTQSTIQHEDGVAEDFSTIMSPPASGPVTSKANLVHDYIDLSPQRSDYLSEATRMEHNESTIGLEGMASEDCKENSNQDKVVYMLQEEIDSLKAKIAELECKCAIGDAIGNREAGETIPELPISEKTAVLDDASKRYTNLEFKVETFFTVGSPLALFLALRNIRIGIG